MRGGLLFLTCLLGCGPAAGRTVGDGGPIDTRSEAIAPQRCNTVDSDSDGVCDSVEVARGTNPNSADTDGDGVNDFDEMVLGSNPTARDSDGDGIADGEELVLGTNPLVTDMACAMVEAQATAVSRPVDIIFVIDNSGSMEAEIEAVEQNINDNFAAIIGASGIDYRIIMLSRHGPLGAQSICVAAPLSGHSCSPTRPARPTNTTNFFHYSEEIESTDSLRRILATYNAADEFNLAPNGWSQWLRPDAYKVFIEFTDDNENGRTAAQFDLMLRALSVENFGTSGDRNYVFHSVIGLQPKPVTTEAYQPEEPLQTERCSGTGLAENNGQTYQELSMLTGGLRFPLCRFDEYDVIFRDVAEGVVEGLSLPCTYMLPISTSGEPVDPARIVLQFQPSSGAAAGLRRVEGVSDCARGGWYLDDSTGVISLCPQACELAEADPAGQIRVLAGCGILIE